MDILILTRKELCESEMFLREIITYTMGENKTEQRNLQK